jgi:hypothetical protein
VLEEKGRECVRVFWSGDDCMAAADTDARVRLTSPECSLASLSGEEVFYYFSTF